MEQEKRIIAYLYEYSQGKKGKSTGYVRIRRQGKQSQVLLHNEMEGEKARVYLFRPQGDGMEYRKLGQVSPEGGYVDETWSLPEETWEMHGLILYASKESYWMSWWKTPEGEERIPAPEEEEREPVPQEDSLGAEAEPEEKPEAATPNAGEEKAPEETLVKPEEEPPKPQEENQENSSKEGAGSSLGESLKSLPPAAPMLQKKYQQVVRGDPMILEGLPGNGKELSRNSFLLTGYCQYGHLLFLEDQQGGCMVGVPGIYTPKEAWLAASFGFGNFQPGGNRASAFGYWLRTLEAEPGKRN